MKALDRLILHYIAEYINRYGYAPCYREIADGVALKSINSVHYHIQRLIEGGYLETDHPGSPRALRLRMKMEKKHG